MSDRSKWPRVIGGQFVQAWINLAELPGGMMQSYSTERGHFRYGPIPGTTSCGITTNPDDARRWREQGQSVMEIYVAHGVAAGAGVQQVAHSLAVSLGLGHGLTQGQAEEMAPQAVRAAGVAVPDKGGWTRGTEVQCGFCQAIKTLGNGCDREDCPCGEKGCNRGQ